MGGEQAGEVAECGGVLRPERQGAAIAAQRLARESGALERLRAFGEYEGLVGQQGGGGFVVGERRLELPAVELVETFDQSRKEHAVSPLRPTPRVDPDLGRRPIEPRPYLAEIHVRHEDEDRSHDR